MEILWTMDTNLAWGLYLSRDHLHKVATCIAHSRDIFLLPSVGAEIKSTLDNNIANIIAFGVSGDEPLPHYTENSLAQKIYLEMVSLKKHYPKLKDDTIIEQFIKKIEHFVSIKTGKGHKMRFSYEREITSEQLRPYIDGNDKMSTLRAYRRYKEDVFSSIIKAINEIFFRNRDSRDRNILLDLIVLSYQYPGTLTCFLTNDKGFYKNWKKVYAREEYIDFLKKNDIKNGIIFHHIPDLENESVNNYEMYPKPSSEEDMINLYQTLKKCS